MPIDKIIDAKGRVRRCGSLPMPRGRVCALPPFGAEPNQILFTDEQIKAIVTDTTRMPSRELFPASWIHDQGPFGACNPTALAAAAARARFTRGVRDGLQFSGAFGYSKINGGRDEGSLIIDCIELATKVGFCPLKDCPPNQIYPRMQKPGLDALAAKHKGLEAFRFVGDLPTKMRALRSALALRIPCIVAVMSGNEFSRIEARGVAGVTRGTGNHAVLVDGVLWDGRRWLYDMANSWGTDYGTDGRAYLTDEHFRQTFGPHEFVAIPAFDEME